MKYTDFVLLANQPSIVRDNGKKRLTFNLLAPGIFDDPMPRELDVMAIRDLMKKASVANADWNDAKRLGEALAAALFPEKIGNTLSNRITQAAALQEGVRVRLIMSGAELNKWPWEFLVFNRAGGELKASDFLALMPNVSVVRHNATSLPTWSIEATPPARVLVGIASPDGWPELEVAEEGEVIEKAVMEMPQFNVETVAHLQRSGLPTKLKPAHLFHFAGHGTLNLM